MGLFLSTYYVAPSRHAEEHSDVGISQSVESAAVCLVLKKVDS